MALTNNPNKNKGIEKKWRAEIKLRWGEAWRGIKQVPIPDLITNLSDTNQVFVDSYIDELTIILMALLLGNDKGAWQNKYQEASYARSVERTTNEAKSLFAPERKAEIATLTGLIWIAGQGTHSNELTFLKDRAKDKLTGWVESLLGEIRGIVHDNFATLTKQELLALIKARLDVSASRARNIATTEVTQAAQRAVINQALILGTTVKQKNEVRWVTAGDSKVRHLHAGWHGQIMTPDEARAKSNISPWNCRCGLRLVNVNRIPARKEAQFRKERKMLLAKEKNNVAK